jgi:hypothetical protein
MGRPCSCNCTSSGVVVDPSDPCLGSDPPPWCHPCSGGEFGTDEVPPWCDPCNGPDPPSYCTGDPVPTSGTGPWKVYLAGYAHSGVHQPDNKYIYAFETEPIIKAFGANCVLAMEENAQRQYAAGRGDAIVFDGNNTYTITEMLAASSGYQRNGIIEAGDSFLQLDGGRISSYGYYTDDDWWAWSSAIYGPIGKIIALDGRSFMYAHTSGTPFPYEDQIYSMGTNFLGKIARDGEWYGEFGTRVEDWVPREINEPQYTTHPYTNDNHVFWPNGGGFHAYEDQGPEPTSPEHFINTFGEAASAGHVHGLYTEGVTTAPFGISTPNNRFLASCAADNWYTAEFYGSNWANGLSINTGSSAARGAAFMQGNVDIAGYKNTSAPGTNTGGGARVQLEHYVVPEALEAPYVNGTQLVTTPDCWGSQGMGYANAEAGPSGCDFNVKGAQPLLMPSVQWNHITGEHEGSSSGLWQGEVTTFEFSLNSSGIPHKRLFTSGVFGVGIGFNAVGGYDQRNTGKIDAGGRDVTESLGGSLDSSQLAWSHSEHNFFMIKFTPVHELIGGAADNSYPFSSGNVDYGLGYYIPDSENFYWSEQINGKTALRTSGVRIAMVGNDACTSTRYHPPPTTDQPGRSETWSQGQVWISMFSQSSGVNKMYIPPLSNTLIYIQYNDEEPNYTNTSGVPASGRRYFDN